MPAKESIGLTEVRLACEAAAQAIGQLPRDHQVGYVTYVLEALDDGSEEYAQMLESLRQDTVIRYIGGGW
jgi:hypothetical protein